MVSILATTKYSEIAFITQAFERHSPPSLCATLSSPRSSAAIASKTAALLLVFEQRPVVERGFISPSSSLLRELSGDTGQFSRGWASSPRAGILPPAYDLESAIL